MVVGAISSRTEVAVIGAGPGGYVAALRAADAGLDVTLIEKNALGGTCLNVGCIPSKALIEIANVRQHALAAESSGLTAQVDVNVPTMMERLQTISGDLRGGVTSLLNAAGVEVIAGTANFARYDRLSIEHGDLVSHLEFDNAIVATGSRPRTLPGFELSSRIVDSTGALALQKLPATMVVIGGGYIGVELGTAWAKLGVQVTIVEASDSLLGEVPAALRRPVERRLKQLGITVVLGELASEPTAQGVRLASGSVVAGDIIVVAIGRQPNSDRCSLGSVGVRTDDHGHIQVDSQMRAARNIYAIGDLVPGPALAHKASAEAEVAVEAIRGWGTSFAPAAIPAVVFSDPEIITVGVTPEQAAAEDLPVHSFPHAASARAKTMGASSGVTIVVADEHDTVLGIHAVGPHVSELAGEATLAIEMAATLEDLALSIHPHPTMSETIAEASWLAQGAPLHFRSTR